MADAGVAGGTGPAKLFVAVVGDGVVCGSAEDWGSDGGIGYGGGVYDVAGRLGVGDS